jgi:hypothetical protein
MNRHSPWQLKLLHHPNRDFDPHLDEMGALGPGCEASMLYFVSEYSESCILGETCRTGRKSG